MNEQELKAARAERDKLQARVKSLFDEAGQDLDLSKVTSLEASSNEGKLQELRGMEAKLTGLNAQINDHEFMANLSHAIEMNNSPQGVTQPSSVAEFMAGLLAQNGGQNYLAAGEQSPTTFGAAFVQSDAFGAREAMADVTMPHITNALFDTGAAPPEVVRSGVRVPSAQRPPEVIDALPVVNVSGASFKYMEETVFDNQAAPVAEGALLPEAALKLEERIEQIREIGVYLPITEISLQDNADDMQAYINARLPLMLRQRVDAQITLGDGQDQNLRGLMNRPGIQTRSHAGDDNIADTVLRALGDVLTVGRTTASHVLMAPADFTALRLLKTSEGSYIYDHPSNSSVTPSIWGVPVVQASLIGQGTAFVGDLANYAALLMRRDITMKVSDSHSDNFLRGILAIKATLRAGLAMYRASAFVKVTGLPQ